MSYSIQDAKYEWEGMLDHALRTHNIEEGEMIAEQFAREGDDEQAFWWEAEVEKWKAEFVAEEKADLMREEYLTRQVERDIEEAERHYSPSEGFKV